MVCGLKCSFFFFFNDTATTEIYTLSLHDALPIYDRCIRPVPSLKASPALRTNPIDTFIRIAIAENYEIGRAHV